MTTITDPIAFLEGYVGDSEPARRAIEMLKASLAPSETRTKSFEEQAADAQREVAEVWDKKVSNDKTEAIEARIKALNAVETMIEEFVKGYDTVTEDEHGHEGVYEPTEEERYLILDAINGLLGESDFLAKMDAWRALCSSPSHGGQDGGEAHFLRQLRNLLAPVSGDHPPAVTRALDEIGARLIELGSIAASSTTREKALAEALQLVLDDWANGNTILDDAMDKAEAALSMPTITASATARGPEITGAERDHLAEWHESLAKFCDQSDDFNGAAFHQGRARELRPTESEKA